MLSPSASSTNRPTLASSSLVRLPTSSGTTIRIAAVSRIIPALALVRAGPSRVLIRSRATFRRPRPKNAATPEMAAVTPAPAWVSPPRRA